MRYSHDAFNNFVMNFEPTADDAETRNNLTQNVKLGQAFLETFSELAYKRMEKAIDQGCNFPEAIKAVKIAELLEAFSFGFSIGRSYEKQSFQEVKDVFGGSGSDE